MQMKLRKFLAHLTENITIPLACINANLHSILYANDGHASSLELIESDILEKEKKNKGNHFIGLGTLFNLNI